MSDSPPLDSAAILAVLDRHGVAYVLIGGFAAQQHGATRPTEDVDITPATDAGNLSRLAAALRELGARVRVAGVPDGLAFDTSAEALRGVSMLNLRCPYGDFDLSFAPSGTDGYEDLVRGADQRNIAGVSVLIASLADIIRSKSAAGRPKDALALPELLRLASTGLAHEQMQREGPKRAQRGRRTPPTRTDYPPGINI